MTKFKYFDGLKGQRVLNRSPKRPRRTMHLLYEARNIDGMSVGRRGHHAIENVPDFVCGDIVNFGLGVDEKKEHNIFNLRVVDDAEAALYTTPR